MRNSLFLIKNVTFVDAIPENANPNKKNHSNF